VRGERSKKSGVGQRGEIRADVSFMKRSVGGRDSHQHIVINYEEKVLHTGSTKLVKRAQGAWDRHWYICLRGDPSWMADKDEEGMIPNALEMGGRRLFRVHGLGAIDDRRLIS
jgi:hypothetical protein